MPQSPFLRSRVAALAACALLTTGCSALRTPTVPLRTMLDKSTCTTHADTLLVMLPGAYSDPEEFVREGYLKAVTERRLAVDVMRVDAHLGYYYGGSIVDRLNQDVIAPARAHGYRAIWILGISIGGFGGLIYANAHPGDLAGLVTVAPYLGERALSLDVANAGGLARWQGQLGAATGDLREQRETQLWQWLKGYASRPRPQGYPPLVLGYGVDDRFAFSQRLLAAALPSDRVFTTPGGHDWPEWTRLWRAILPPLQFPVCAG